MVKHSIQNHPDTGLMSLLNQILQIFLGPKIRIYFKVVYGCVLVIEIRMKTGVR